MGKCNLINILVKSGKLDKTIFSGNTILLKISEENNKNTWVYVGAKKIFSFITNVHILEYISVTGDNMIPYSITIGVENLSFLSPHCKRLKTVKIGDDELLKTNGKSMDPFDYQLEKHCPSHFENSVVSTVLKTIYLYK